MPYFKPPNLSDIEIIDAGTKLRNNYRSMHRWHCMREHYRRYDCAFLTMSSQLAEKSFSYNTGWDGRA